MSSPPPPSQNDAKATAGWREWVKLPDLGIDRIKVKLDTGARTSALHAFDIRILPGGRRVRFKVHPMQRDAKLTIETEADLIEHRHIRSSVGHVTHRPVIQTHIELHDRRWPIEVTLVNRDAMGFRMLLGRQAMRGHLIVDPARSFTGGRPGKKNKKKIKKKRQQRNSS